MIATTCGIEVHVKHEPNPVMTVNQLATYSRICTITSFKERVKKSCIKIKNLAEWFENTTTDIGLGPEYTPIYFKKLRKILSPIVATDNDFAKNLLILLDEWINNKSDGIDSILMEEIIKLMPEVKEADQYSSPCGQATSQNKDKSSSQSTEDHEIRQIIEQHAKLVELIAEYNSKALAKGLPIISVEDNTPFEE